MRITIMYPEICLTFFKGKGRENFPRDMHDQTLLDETLNRWVALREKIWRRWIEGWWYRHLGQFHPKNAWIILSPFIINSAKETSCKCAWHERWWNFPLITSPEEGTNVLPWFCQKWESWSREPQSFRTKNPLRGAKIGS